MCRCVDVCPSQCLVNVLKSLVYWEKLRREAKQNKDKQSIHEEVSSEDPQADTSNGSANTFEKVKAQKSTIEAAISEVFISPINTKQEISLT